MSLTNPKASMQIRSAPPMHAPLKIAIIAHSLYPIAQPYAGGLEMITQLLCDELVARGHDVLLYAHEDSQTQANLQPLMTREQFDALVYDNEHDSVGMSREDMYQYLVYQQALSDIIARDNRGEIDIVHNHSLYHVPMLTGQAFGKRFFTTFHTPIFPHIRLALLTLQQGTATQFTSISAHQQQLFDEFVPSHVVYNGIDVDSFTANIEPINEEVYFWYGRICPEKGTHLAMQYCQTAGKRLIIAGPKSNQEYFDSKVAPLLAADADKADGEALFTYVGHLTKDQINDYLCQATAMLFTSTWDEPYGLTLAESLACGTPVIGFNVGAAAEIINDETGIIVPKCNEQAFVAAFDTIKTRSRAACRARAEQFCSVAAMVDGYVDLYRQALSLEPLVSDSASCKASNTVSNINRQNSVDNPSEATTQNKDETRKQKVERVV